MNAPKDEYVLLFRNTDWYKTLPPEKLQKVAEQAKAWFDGWVATGKLAGGKPLVDGGVLVSGKNGRNVSDGPFAESKEAIGGFLVLHAASLKEAVAIAGTNPSLAYGTSIEVRPVAAECPMGDRAPEKAGESQDAGRQ